MAHPCVSDVEASLGKTLTLHTGGSWAGALPSSNAALGHECGEDFNSYVYAGNTAQTSAMGEPIGDAISTFNVSRLTGLGYSARNVPLTGTGNGVYNSDLAFKDNLVIQGTYEGFRIVDFTNKSNPTQIINYTGCSVGQGDVVVYGNILVRSWDAPAGSTATCAGRSVPQGFEGVHIWNISNPAQPEYIRDLRFSQAGMPAGALLGCGSHTATAVPDPARGHLYIYNGGSSGTCSGIDVFRIKISDPSDAVVIRRASNGRPGNSCHDNNVLMGVGGGTVGYAMCAGGNGLSMYAFDMAKGADEAGTPASPGGVENPTLMWSRVDRRRRRRSLRLVHV